jgi:hypothetical protein
MLSPPWRPVAPLFDESLIAQLEERLLNFLLGNQYKWITGEYRLFEWGSGHQHKAHMQIGVSPDLDLIAVLKDQHMDSLNLFPITRIESKDPRTLEDIGQCGVVGMCWQRYASPGVKMNIHAARLASDIRPEPVIAASSPATNRTLAPASWTMGIEAAATSR